MIKIYDDVVGGLGYTASYSKRCFKREILKRIKTQDIYSRYFTEILRNLSQQQISSELLSLKERNKYDMCGNMTKQPNKIFSNYFISMSHGLQGNIFENYLMKIVLFST